MLMEYHFAKISYYSVLAVQGGNILFNAYIPLQ